MKSDLELLGQGLKSLPRIKSMAYEDLKVNYCIFSVTR